MQTTPQFNLPLIQSGQAQKHITMNEALTRLDALAQLRLISLRQSAAPSNPSEGAAYYLQQTVTGIWHELRGKIAIYSNGNWVGIDPKIGWTAWVEADKKSYIYNGTDWVPAGMPFTSNGAMTESVFYEHTHEVINGNANTTRPFIPSKSIVFGVTARVVSTIAVVGRGSSWTLGVAGSHDRYGTGYGLTKNSYALGITGQPLAYYSNAGLRIMPNEGYFNGGGEIIFTVHAMRLSPPREVS